MLLHGNMGVYACCFSSMQKQILVQLSQRAFKNDELAEKDRSVEHQF